LKVRVNHGVLDIIFNRKTDRKSFVVSSIGEK
jgi:hypothetical protein